VETENQRGIKMKKHKSIESDSIDNNKTQVTKKQIRDRKNYLNRFFFKAVGLQLLTFAFLTFIILIIPSNLYDEVFSSISNWIVNTFSSSKAWSNSSPVYRDKLVVVYVLFYLCFFLMFVGLLYSMIRNRNELFTNFVPLRSFHCKYFFTTVLVGTFILIMTISIVFFLIPTGSNELLTLNEMDNSSKFFWFKDSFKWNSLWGLVINKSLSLGLFFYFILFNSQVVFTWWWCLKNSKQ
jgi:hypothetical protein